jgi:hypothetical protein
VKFPSPQASGFADFSKTDLGPMTTLNLFQFLNGPRCSTKGSCVSEISIGSIEQIPEI